MEQLFPRAALPLPPPHWFLPMLWDSLAPCPPSSYLGKVPLQNASPDQDFLEEGLSPGTVWSHSQGTRECTEAQSWHKKLSLKEPQYVERGAVTLRIEAAAAGLDRRASSLCSSRIPALSHSVWSQNLCLGHFCGMCWWDSGFLWLCLPGWGTVSVLSQAGQMWNDVSKSRLGQVQRAVPSPPHLQQWTWMQAALRCAVKARFWVCLCMQCCWSQWADRGTIQYLYSVVGILHTLSPSVQITLLFNLAFYVCL